MKNEGKDKEPRDKKTMTKQAKIHEKTQSTKLASYTEGKKKNDTIKKASFPTVLKLEV